MKYNLTEKQKDCARWLVQEVRKNGLPESIGYSPSRGSFSANFDTEKTGVDHLRRVIMSGEVNALEAEGLLRIWQIGDYRTLGLPRFLGHWFRVIISDWM
jgi:hypothetical protein